MYYKDSKYTKKMRKNLVKYFYPTDGDKQKNPRGTGGDLQDKVFLNFIVKPQSHVASPVLVTKLELGNQNAHP